MDRDVESFDDLVQYYQYSYVRSRRDPTLMFYVRAAYGANRAYVTKYKNGKPLPADVGMPAEYAVMTEREINDHFTWGLPNIGMTVVNDRELLYFYYRTQRTGHRGLGGERLRMHSFNGNVLRQHKLPALYPDNISDPVVAWQILTQQYTSIADVFDELTKKVPNKLAYALSPKFGVHLSLEEPHPVVCYKLAEVGWLSNRTAIKLKEEYRELADVVKRTFNDVEVRL